MKSHIARRARLAAAAGVILLGAVACKTVTAESEKHEIPPAPTMSNAEESKAAFLKAYTVLMSPRCMNCHPNGDVPLQGEDSHLHTQNVKRGPDGRGLFSMKCSSCHQLENRPGANMPPGHPDWRLPPADRPMVFEGRTPAQLARQFKDPKETGKTLVEMVHHVEEDSLVLAGWNPGEGRAKPPLSHEEFAAAFKEWVDKGAVIPE